MSRRDQRVDEPPSEDDWSLPFEAELHEFAPTLHAMQKTWLAQIDSLRAPDRKTHELIRMVCAVIKQHSAGITRHAMLAAEVGASWEEIFGSIMITQPAFGVYNVAEALPWARKGWEQGHQMALDEDDED